MRLPQLLTIDRGTSLFLPAHGRGKALPVDIRELLQKNPAVWDLPELPDIGGPLFEKGAIAISQSESAKIVGADHCWYGVNGASGLLQAALLSISKPKQSVLLPRNVHKSIINACVLGDLTPILFDLPFNEELGHFSPPNLEWFQRVINALNARRIEISSVVLTNPTYHGYSINLEPLVALIHRKGIPVLVDEAHGTYFLAEPDDYTPKSALFSGADLVVNSLHKSANGLTQTAVLWRQGTMVDPCVIEKYLSLFQTTSPSSLLIASCEASIRQLRSNSGLNNLRKTLGEARQIKNELSLAGLPLVDNEDPLKIILHTASVGINGLTADSWFISRGLIGELPEPGTLTFCLGFASHSGLIKEIKTKWDQLLTSDLPRDLSPPFSRPLFPLLSSPEISCRSAFQANSENLPLYKAIGRFSATIVSPYPPGIPLLLPGELLDKKRVNWMICQKTLWGDLIPSEISVII